MELQYVEQLLSEIGVNEIDPNTHYTVAGKSRDKIKAMLIASYGSIQVTDELVDVFIESEEVPYVEHVHEVYGVVFQDRLEHMDDRVQYLASQMYDSDADPLSRYYRGL